MKSSQKGFVVPVIAIIVLLLIGGSYFYFENSKTDEINIEQAQNFDVAIPTDWETYTNSIYGFSFQYPNDEKVVLVDGDFKNNVGQKIISVNTRVSNEDSHITCNKGIDTRCDDITTQDSHAVVIQFGLSGNVTAHVLQQGSKSALLSLSCDSTETGMTGKDDYCTVSEERVSMFKNVLSTFKFFDSDASGEL